MSTRSTETAEHISSQERERRVFRYLASYGQHPETERKYRPAIEACQSVLYLSQTVSEIARLGYRESGYVDRQDPIDRYYGFSVRLVR